MARLTLVSHHLCPYVQRVAIALLEKAVPFERVTIDLASPPEWFGRVSPLGKVPLLRIRHSSGSEAALFESTAICEFIEETQPGPKLHPEDALERARHRAWIEFGSAILADIWLLETATDSATYAAARTAVAAKFASVEAVLHAGPYFAGSRFSLVDAVFGPIFRYFDVFDSIAETGAIADIPKVRAWRAALARRESVHDAVSADYPERLKTFLIERGAHLIRLSAKR
jgi:glutathione S-transferase